MEEYYNLVCPKGYGKITFVQSGRSSLCPVSGKKNCMDCYHSFVEERDKLTEKK